LPEGSPHVDARSDRASCAPTWPLGHVNAVTAQGLNFLSLSYFCAFAGTFAFLVVLEGGAAASTASGRGRHIARNIGLFALILIVADGVVLTWLIGVPFRLTESNGVLTSLALPAFAEFALGFLLLDVFDYGFHRLIHRVRWLWLIHAVHHSDTRLDATTGVRFHPAEVTIQVVLKTGLLLTLGIPLWVEGARAVFVNPANLLQHANVAFPDWVERWFSWLLVTPAMHRIHHSPEMLENNSNYGAILSIWDRIFGTYRRPQKVPLQNVGLRKLQDDSWQTLVGMLMTPVRARGLGSL
jgi:sterol desaturase/sphingolipid hydroxylase (fatty acid hydroxylase superfamily)